MLHGTADVNVPYLHSVRLIDALLKNKKGPLVEFMTYPGEFHYFTREHVLKDAWTRVDQFFARWLTPTRASTPNSARPNSQSTPNSARPSAQAAPKGGMAKYDRPDPMLR